jgi:signal transduction histidine kinase
MSADFQARCDMNAEVPNILVVDDDAANRRLLEAILLPQGYSITMAARGDVAVDIVSGGTVDLVLMDLTMPGMDGVEACRIIREDLQMPFLPVVLVTALNDQVSRTRAKKAGADDFINKPVYEDELLARVRTLLRAKRYQDELREHHQAVQHEARRWRLVCRVAEEVSSAASFDQIAVRLQSALAADLPIATPTFCFEGGELPPGAADHIAIPLSTTETSDALLLVQPLDDMKRFGENEIELLLSLAPHISNSIARVRLAETQRSLERTKQRLTALVIHDLKNPLAVVQMNLELARLVASDGGVGAGSQEILAPLGDAADAAGQLSRMMLDLLDISRAEDGNLPFSPALIDLAILVSDTSERLRCVIERRGASLDCVLPAGSLSARCDASLIVRVLQNLLTNAARFAPEHGVVEVRVARQETPSGATALLSVSNDGPSIPADVQAQLFDKYGQVNGNQEHGNRGLGLYLCRLVAERHGGSISMSDRAPHGVTFTLSLPLA